MQTADLVPLNDAVREWIPGTHNPSTVWRWVMRGLAGLDGQKVRLQVWYVGRRPHTTAKAVQEWLNAVTAARLARSLQGANVADIATDEELATAGLSGNRR